MDNEFIVWTSDLPLSELTLFRDWDYSTSQYTSLRYYWEAFGTIPHWNLALCGGTPVMSNPNNPGFSLQSLPAYLLPPNWAFIMQWLVMILLGIFCIYKLLQRWSIGPLGAATGALLFGFNGLFGSHFNQGHHGFAFFCLIPMLMLFFDSALKAVEEEKSPLWPTLGITLATWLLFTAGIPHTIFHFYPALLLFLLFRLISLARRTNFRHALKCHAAPLIAHILGFVLAFYKFGAVMAWQMKFPRGGVAFERITLLDLLSTTLRMVPDYFKPEALIPGQSWGYWEYNTYIGPLPVILVFIALLALGFGAYRHWRYGTAPGVFSYGIALGACLLVCGVLLSLGNDHPLSPARLFRYFPLINGIRVFTRYQILTLFGMTVLVAYAMTLIERFIDRRSLKRTLGLTIKAAMLIILCAPAAYQAGLLIWNIKAMSNRELRDEVYGLWPQPADEPVLMKPLRTMDWSTQTVLLQNNYFPAQCYEQLTSYYLNLQKHPSGSSYLMTNIKGVHLAHMTTNTFGLSFPDDLREKVQMHLLIPPEFKINIEGKQGPDGLLTFEPEQLRGKTLIIDTTLPAETIAFFVSLGGIMLSVLFFGTLARSRANAKKIAAAD